MKFALLVAAFVLPFAGSVLAQDEAPWNQAMCPNGVEAAMGKLPTFNPYDTGGRCFRFMGRSVQLLDRSRGLFSFMSSDSPFAMVDFGKSSAPVNFYSGVVLSKGAYPYVTIAGSRNIIFSFVDVPRSKARTEWDRKQAIEADRKAREEVSARESVLPEKEPTLAAPAQLQNPVPVPKRLVPTAEWEKGRELDL